MYILVFNSKFKIPVTHLTASKNEITKTYCQIQFTPARRCEVFCHTHAAVRDMRV